MRGAVLGSGAFHLLLLVVLSLPAWPYSAGWGYYPSSGLGLILIVMLILLLARRPV